jgi:pyruvate, water dikinase
MTLTLIKNFTQISKTDTLIAGGKGASLGEMIQAGISVPNGFVILSNTFDIFIKETNLIVEIDAILNSVNIKKVQTIENASKKIQAMIISKEIPKDIKTEIFKFYKNLNCNFVAVRSSATSEDSTSAAWAGQLDSFLNTTNETLLKNVKNCWASLFTPRAIYYRFEKKLNKDKISVAVIVQKMVDSEKSGVAFSVHPVTQDKNQIIIEAGFGLGEAIVSGSITPDNYVINKQKLNILDINVNEQTRALYKKPKGGNEWKELKEKGKKQVLTEKEIIDLSKLIVKIENHYGFPCDIEWAKEKKKFYIVQSRPITTLIKGNEKEEVIFDIWLSRPYPILQIEAYNEFLTRISKEVGCTITHPIFLYNPETKLVTLYYNMKELIPAIGQIGNKVISDDLFRKKIFFELMRVFEEIKIYFDDNKKIKTLKEFEDFFELFTEYMKYVGYTWILPGLDFIPQKIKDEAMRLRKKTENYASRRDSIMLNFADKLINNKKINPMFLSMDEIKTIPRNAEKLTQKRLNGFLYYQGKIILQKDVQEFLKLNNFQIRNPTIESNSEIKGMIAQKGIIRGRAKIVYTENELSKISSGDILVTPMTRPEFIPAMKKAKAFVTDEGGIVCHAAITAREMKKPCIIGTKVATKVLKDGDLIEVDANNGIVKILKKKKY